MVHHPLYRGRHPHPGLKSKVRPSSRVAPHLSPAKSTAPLRQNHTVSSGRPSYMCPAFASKPYNFHHNVDVTSYGKEEGYTGSNPMHLQSCGIFFFHNRFATLFMIVLETEEKEEVTQDEHFRQVEESLLNSTTFVILIFR